MTVYTCISVDFNDFNTAEKDETKKGTFSSVEPGKPVSSSVDKMAACHKNSFLNIELSTKLLFIRRQKQRIYMYCYLLHCFCPVFSNTKFITVCLPSTSLSKFN